jgi:membrane-bound lytic murein transglycosylase A
MIDRRSAGLVLAALLFALCGIGSFAAQAQTRLEPVSFASVPGWDREDYAAAFAAFLHGCSAISGDARLAPAPRAACAAAAKLARPVDARAAKSFFERFFRPMRVETQAGGFFTAYFEPEFHGSLRPSKRFPTPLLARPDDLDKRKPYFDRNDIERGALARRHLELVWLDPIDAFFVHIQGSGRIRLSDGRVLRVGFDGRNGLPYTPIGRTLIERGALTASTVSMQTIRAWLEANPAQAAEVMRENRSYIFFKILADRPLGEGPVGGAGLPLLPRRSLAVDHRLWPYGLPVFVDTELPGSGPFRRLLIAEDTGTAIRGAARGDIFLGSGAEAGAEAGLMKHSGSFIVFMPREAGR